MDRQIISTEALSEVLRRAQEIDAGAHDSPDLEAYIQAAEEAGISREATTQAIRERLGYPISAAKLGEFVFARSADGHYYAAKVDSTAEKTARVRFMNGAIAELPLSDLREFTVLPGQKVNYLSPSGGYWANGTVVSFNADAQVVTLEVWGASESVSLDKVRQLGQNMRMGVTAKANEWAIRFWWLFGGVGLGFLLDRLIMR